jgi:hypothetical protein
MNNTLDDDWFEADPAVVVTLLDAVTGDIRVVEGIREFEWVENNLSCDCNRSTFFDNWGESNTCVAIRYIIIDVVYDNPDMLYNYKTYQFNQDYPKYLLEKYMDIE